jgi:hypothetical protein
MWVAQGLTGRKFIDPKTFQFDCTCANSMQFLRSLINVFSSGRPVPVNDLQRLRGEIEKLLSFHAQSRKRFVQQITEFEKFARQIPEPSAHCTRLKLDTPPPPIISRGFHLINVLEKGRKFNVMHYITEMLSPLSEWWALDAPESNRKSMVHGDARLHTARLSAEFFEENHMKTAPHSPYSPDIAPSDFYLFGMSKNVWPIAHSWMQRIVLKHF